MIRSLRGKVISKTPPELLVEVGGVGYGINTPLDVFDQVETDKEVFLYIHHDVGESKEELYGFLQSNRRDFFELLLSVSGVGPKSALSVVSSNETKVLRSAIAEGNTGIFVNASGIGKKTAGRIIVDLKSKIGIQPGLASGYGDTYEALRALGYTANEAKKAISQIPSEVKDDQERIKAALKSLVK